MVISESLPFIREYVAAINESIKQNNTEQQLSRLQSYWLGFVILGLLVTNSFCWVRYERFGLGRYHVKQMSWMFRQAQIVWELLLQASVQHIITSYKIKYGVLVIDDTDIERSKNTTKIAKVHTIRDKKTSGYLRGQNLVFLLLVCEKVTIPVGFFFYEPDPEQAAWRKEDARLRKKLVAKKYRPIQPAGNQNYPSKKELALKLLSEFGKTFSDVKVKSVIVDAAYCTLDFIDKASEYTKQSQVISQIKKNQLIVVNNKEIPIADFFENYQGHTERVSLRGEERIITYRSGRFKVKSYKKKYFVIALKYSDESEYRYLIAQDMTWRDTDIIKTFAFSWLVEVFIQDWKQYEGWNQLAKQPGEEGSSRGVTLSLLSDHALLLQKDTLSNVIIPAFDIEMDKTFFFKTNRAKTNPLRNYMLKDIARATSAAPTYFEPAEVMESTKQYTYILVDGGMSVNNPAISAAAYAVELFGKDVHLFVVSLGTGTNYGSKSNLISREEVRTSGLLGWATKIIPLMMHAVDDVTDYEANIVLNSHNIHHDYYRLQPIIEAEHINMDDVSPKNIKALEQYAQNIIQQNENQLQAIANFLNEHVIENYPILNNKAYEKE